jgi:hypothetical protein
MTGRRIDDPTVWGDVYGEEGEGALSKEELYIDKNAIEEAYESPAATSVGNASERGDSENRLQRINEGRDQGADGHSERMHDLDRKRIMQAICSSLLVSQPEKDLAIDHFEPLDLDQFGNQKGIEKVALATVRYVVDQRRLDHGADYDDLLRESPEYEEVKARVLEDESGFMKLCSKVEDALEEQTLGTRTGFGDVPGPDPIHRNARQQ